MATLYYGKGFCTIEGADIRGVQIRYSGKIKITDKSPDGFALAHQGNNIMIFPVSSRETLNDLFEYNGDFKILSVKATNNNIEEVPTSIKRSMDYTGMLDSKVESLTTKYEDLNSTYTYGDQVNKTTLNKPHIENLNTDMYTCILYLEDGNVYNGDFHIHLSDSTAMTGAVHNDSSEELYIKRIGKDYKMIDKLIPTKKVRTIKTSSRGGY